MILEQSHLKALDEMIDYFKNKITKNDALRKKLESNRREQDRLAGQTIAYMSTDQMLATHCDNKWPQLRIDVLSKIKNAGEISNTLKLTDHDKIILDRVFRGLDFHPQNSSSVSAIKEMQDSFSKLAEDKVSSLQKRTELSEGSIFKSTNSKADTASRAEKSTEDRDVSVTEPPKRSSP